jgi:hypothetical protein
VVQTERRSSMRDAGRINTESQPNGAGPLPHFETSAAVQGAFWNVPVHKVLILKLIITNNLRPGC